MTRTGIVAHLNIEAGFAWGFGGETTLDFDSIFSH
jgi:hypothetical protein